MTALMMDLAVLLASVNSLLLVGLVLLYVRIAVRSRAVYPAGLVIFAAFLLLHNLLTVYSYVSMTPLFAEATLPYLFSIGLFETVGITALLKVTL